MDMIILWLSLLLETAWNKSNLREYWHERIVLKYEKEIVCARRDFLAHHYAIILFDNYSHTW
jgi:uncharacterized protein (DUF2225 family)